MLNKAFTLVEMALVIIIIGVLVSFATYGKYLYNNAATTKEITKIVNIITAVKAFKLRNATLPDNPKQLVDQDFLNAKDATSKWLVDNTDFAFTKVRYTTANSVNKSTYTVDNTYGRIYVLTTLKSYKLSARYVCNIERVLDDVSILSGMGRGGPGSSDIPGTNVYTKCDSFSYKNTHPNVNTYFYFIDNL